MSNNLPGKNLIAFICCVLFPMLANSQASDYRAAVTLENTETYLIYSKDIDQHFLIDVFLPKDYQPKKSEHQFPKYPVIYVLNSRPNAVMAAAQRHVSEMPREILVGIDYADKDGNPINSFSAYTRDLTPTSDKNWMQAQYAGAGGGAEKFLQFINTQVKPLINTRYTVNQHNQTLVGHSFGGLFGFYVLLKHSESFNRYVICSPSLWWDNAILKKFEEEYANTHNNMNKKVFISVGANEFKGGQQDMIIHTQTIVNTIKSRNYPDLKIEFTTFEDETHESVVAPSIHKGMKFVLD